jgi:tetratricopeptide (TPR) repeat protein
MRLSRFDESERAYDTARVFTLASSAASTQAEFDSLIMARWFMLGELSKSEEWGYRVLSLDPDPSESEDSYFVRLNHSRARAFEILGAVEARRERYSEQSAYICRALGELKCVETPDVWHELSLLGTLSVLVRDLGLDAEASLLRERLAEEWPAEAVGFRFGVLRALGIWAASKGDHVGALRDLRAAAEHAPSPVFRLAATLDRAFLARELHQAIMAREELDYAERLSAQIDWPNAFGEDRFVLLLLAEVLADRSASKARRAMDRYRGIKTKLPPNYIAAGDRRWEADECFAEATVLRAEGHFDRARVYFAKAFEILDAVGYTLKAARAALEIAEISKEPRFAEYARSEARERPNSWLATRVGRLEV